MKIFDGYEELVSIMTCPLSLTRSANCPIHNNKPGRVRSVQPDLLTISSTEDESALSNLLEQRSTSMLSEVGMVSVLASL